MLVMAVALVAVSFPVKNRFQTREREARDPLRENRGFVIALVHCEAAALLGLVVHFVTGSPQYWVLMAIGLVGILLHRPRRRPSDPL
jgi:MYXO-CTERM domain-containing protein